MVILSNLASSPTTIIACERGGSLPAGTLVIPASLVSVGLGLPSTDHCLWSDHPLYFHCPSPIYGRATTNKKKLSFWVQNSLISMCPFPQVIGSSCVLPFNHHQKYGKTVGSTHLEQGVQSSDWISWCIHNNHLGLNLVAPRAGLRKQQRLLNFSREPFGVLWDFTECLVGSCLWWLPWGLVKLNLVNHMEVLSVFSRCSQPFSVRGRQCLRPQALS